jgi:hypothetical protein
LEAFHPVLVQLGLAVGLVRRAGVVCPSILALVFTLVAEVPEALLGIPVVGELAEIITLPGPQAVVVAPEVVLVVAAPLHPTRVAAVAVLEYLAKALMALGVLSLLAAAAAGLAAQVVVAPMADFMAAAAAAVPTAVVGVASDAVLSELSGLAVHAAHLHSPQQT